MQVAYLFKALKKLCRRLNHLSVKVKYSKFLCAGSHILYLTLN